MVSITIETTMADAPERNLTQSEDLSMEQVHMAWLTAGVTGDAETMKHLLAQYPQWLNLERLIDTTSYSFSTPTHNRFCSWEYFHLPTIGASALLTAAWDGCIDIVELLLKAGQDPNTYDDGGLTSMMVTILRYNVVVMRCVFRNGEAIRRNLVVDCHEEEHQLLQRVLGVVTLLLRFGADVNAQNQEGHTALHYAGNGDALNVAKVLLDAGADINVQDENGKTPLHHCIREGSLLVANLLVSRGAQIDCEDMNGETPLTLALHRGNMLQIILNQHHLVATAARRDFATSVLLSAVENEVDEVVRLLIEGGYSAVTVSNNHGETPVHLAIVKRNSQLMETLIGLDPTRGILTAGTLAGDTPVHYAARYGSDHVVERLLHYLSIEFGDLQVLNDATNPLNAVNNENSTCLYLAGTRTVSLGHHQEERDTIVQVLVRHGAHLFLRHDDIFHSGSSEQVIFHEPVGRGFALWAQEATEFEIEDGDDGDDIMEARSRDVLLTDFCVEWVAALASLPSSWSVGETNWPDFAAVLHVVVSAGYTLDLLPLLLVLPVHRLSLAALLDRLDRFARFPHPHMMLVQLHVELSRIMLDVTDT